MFRFFVQLHTIDKRGNRNASLADWICGRTRCVAPVTMLFHPGIIIEMGNSPFYNIGNAFIACELKISAQSVYPDRAYEPGFSYMFRFAIAMSPGKFPKPAAAVRVLSRNGIISQQSHSIKVALVKVKLISAGYGQHCPAVNTSDVAAGLEVEPAFLNQFDKVISNFFYSLFHPWVAGQKVIKNHSLGPDVS